MGGGPPIGGVVFKGFLLLLGCFGLFFIVVGLFWDIFWLFWVLEGVVFDDFDWDPILVVFCLFWGLFES